MEYINSPNIVIFVEVIIPTVLFMCAVIITVTLVRLAGSLSLMAVAVKHISERLEEDDDSP